MTKKTSCEESVDLLAALIQADSENPPGNTSRCASIIIEKLTEEGIDCEIQESIKDVHNVVAHLKGKKTKDGEGKTLLFNGHIDTVPAGKGWSFNPFGAEIKDGYMYGRGSTDMKAGIASSLMSFIEAKRDGADFNGEIIFTAVGDEEFHSLYGTKWLLAEGLKADFAVNCEPTNLNICLGNRGLIMVDVLVKGRSSHGGRPGLGSNAISRACAIVNKLEDLDFEYSRNDNFIDPVGSLSIVGIHGGDRINIIPDSCIIYIDRRLMPNESSEIAIKQIENAIFKATNIMPDYEDGEGCEIVIKPEIWHEPFWIDKKNAFIKQCIGTYRNYFKKEPEFEGKSAGTDASHLVSIGKIPTVIFGPGDYRVSHTIDERVEISQLQKATEYYSQLIKTVLK